MSSSERTDSNDPRLDIATNRSTKKYSRNELLLRVAWSIVKPLFRFSPRRCFGWRRQILRLFGAQVGNEVQIYASSLIYYPWKLSIGDYSSIGEDALIYNLGQINIGKRTTISHKAHLCAGSHDYTDPTLPLLRPPINIGDDVWICAAAFIGPDVTIERGAVVGAMACVFGNVEAWTVVGGNPAKFLKKRHLKNDLPNSN